MEQKTIIFKVFKIEKIEPVYNEEIKGSKTKPKLIPINFYDTSHYKEGDGLYEFEDNPEMVYLNIQGTVYIFNKILFQHSIKNYSFDPDAGKKELEKKLKEGFDLDLKTATEEIQNEATVKYQKTVEKYKNEHSLNTVSEKLFLRTIAVMNHPDAMNDINGLRFPDG